MVTRGDETAAGKQEGDLKGRAPEFTECSHTSAEALRALSAPLTLQAHTHRTFLITFLYLKKHYEFFYLKMLVPKFLGFVDL